MARTKLFTVTHKDCIFQTFTVGGPGGGGKDTSQTGIRWIHEPSGAVGEGREERRQDANKKKAWERLGKHSKMEKWCEAQAALMMGKAVAVDPKEVMAQVDRMIEDGIKNGDILVEEF